MSGMSSQPCKPVPVGRLSMLSTVSCKCDREECPKDLHTSQPFPVVTAEDKGQSLLVNKWFECERNNKTVQQRKQTHEPNKNQHVSSILRQFKQISSTTLKVFNVLC